MHPATLYLALRDAGISCRAAGGKLLVNPVASLTGELREQVLAQRAELLAWLEAAADDEARAAAVAALLPPDFGSGCVLLESVELVRLHEDGEPPSYMAVHPLWLDCLREVAAVERRHQTAKDGRQRKARKERGSKQQGDLL